MKILGRKTVTLTRTSGAQFDRRGRIANGGPKVLRLSNGFLKGWWVVEARGKAWPRTPVEIHLYAPAAKLFVTTTQRAAIYRLDSAGNEIEGKVVTLVAGQKYASARSAVVTGRPAWHLDGPYRDWWLPMKAAVKVYREPK